MVLTTICGLPGLSDQLHAVLSEEYRKLQNVPFAILEDLGFTFEERKLFIVPKRFNLYDLKRSLVFDMFILDSIQRL